MVLLILNSDKPLLFIPAVRYRGQSLSLGPDVSTAPLAAMASVDVTIYVNHVGWPGSGEDGLGRQIKEERLVVRLLFAMLGYSKNYLLVLPPVV